MSQIPSWFERKFEFTFPAEQYPNVCVRLRGTPARLEEMLRDIPQPALIGKPAGKWTAQEHAGHLLDMEPLWSARVEDFLGENGTLTVADLSNRRTHEANYNGCAHTGLLAGFRTARLQWLQRLNGLAPAFFERSLIHPRLQQPMRLVDHLYFVAEHDDHHLARIWELVSG